MYTFVKMDFSLFCPIFSIHFIVLAVWFDGPYQDQPTLQFHNSSNIISVNFQPFCAFLMEFGFSFHIFNINSLIL